MPVSRVEGFRTPPPLAGVLKEPDATPGSASSSALPEGPQSRMPAGFDWRRFWVRTALAALAFNLAAGLLTWFWIFPHLFPAR